MRNIRVAALTAAAVGLGVFAVGCGPVPSTGSSPTLPFSSTKVAQATGKATEIVDKAKELGEKVKGVTEEVNKEVTPLQAAFEKLKTKFTEDEKAAGTDATKLAAVNTLKGTKDTVEKLLKEITDKIGAFKDLKDLASLDGAKKAIMEIVDKLKPMLKDFMPAAK